MDSIQAQSIRRAWHILRTRLAELLEPGVELGTFKRRTLSGIRGELEKVTKQGSLRLEYQK